MNKNKRLYIDMCAGSELMDTQGETLSIEGANIDDLKRFNDNHGKGFFNSLGIVTEAKKIFKAEDCENERHRYYWEKIKAPYIYAAGYLHNDEDHPNARAAAAILRNIHRDDIPLKLKASVEGGVISRGIKDLSRLAQTKIHSVALTFTPANNATLVEPINVDKTNSDWEADKQLIKSVVHLAETNVPSFRHIQRHASANTIYENINKIQELAKSIGLEIDIKETNPETIMKKAVLSKLNNNINKINDLVKALKANNMLNYMKPSASQAPSDIKPAAVSASAEPSAPSVGSSVTPKDKFQQEIGQLKSNPNTPVTPKSSQNLSSDALKVQDASQVKSTNAFKGHASKAMRDPAHMDTVVNSLKQRGIPDETINKIVSNIKSHMQSDLGKSEIEKADIGRAAKGIILAGVLANAAHDIGTKEDKKKEVKEVQENRREVASKEARRSDIDPDILPGSKRQGYDERQPNAKKKFKDKMKKALLAGYGGAGAPTNLTSGGIFQAESVEGSRKSDDGLKYIVCDDCGHEQVHMKHQVKCRKCRKNFNLNKLEGLI